MRHGTILLSILIISLSRFPSISLVCALIYRHDPHYSGMLYTGRWCRLASSSLYSLS